MGYSSSSSVVLCLFLFFTFAFVSSARHSISFPGNKMVMMRERSLMVSTNDYGEPSANVRHDPPRGGRSRRR